MNKATALVPPPRPWARLLWVAAALVVIGGGAALLWVRQSRVVRWSEVLEAVSQQRTINGVGRVYAADGTEWAVALWVQVDEQKTFPANSMLVPAGAVPKGKRPDETIGRLAGAANYLSAEGADLPGLVRRHPRQLGEPVEWGGRPALAVTEILPFGLSIPTWTVPPVHAPPPASVRWYLDRETSLPLATEVSDLGKLVVRTEYRYNQPLPPGFKPM